VQQSFGLHCFKMSGSLLLNRSVQNVCQYSLKLFDTEEIRYMKSFASLIKDICL